MAINLYEKINNKLNELTEIKHEKKIELKNLLDNNKSKNLTKSKIISFKNFLMNLKSNYY
jgi:hypothetical protein